jgi:hypothetical protein
VKKVLLYTLSTLLFYCLLRDMSAVKILLICGALAFVYGVYRVPARYVAGSKYPAILLSFAATVCLFFYPHTVVQAPVQVTIMFLAFYGMTLYLATLDEKGKGFFKEVAALSVLFLTSAFNLAVIGQATFMLSLAFSVMLFLFIIGRHRVIPFIAGYTVVIGILLYSKGMAITGAVFGIGEVERYMLLGVTFALLLTSFIGTLKKVDFVKLLPFFGFLYLAVDVFMVVGFRFSGGLLHQPLLSLLVASPLVGLMLKPAGGRA